MVAPHGALMEGPEGGTIWLYNCQNSLKTRLKYIKITLQVDSYKKNLALAQKNFFRGGSGGPENFRKFIKRRFFLSILPPPPLKNPVSAPEGEKC